MTTSSAAQRFVIHDLDYLGSILACPNCRRPLAVPAEGDLACAGCGSRFRRLAFTWDFLPAEPGGPRELWEVWDQLQENGVASYTHDPQRNLGVGPRPDHLAFGRFCQFGGTVLDVGCGPQAWPTHFEQAPSETRLLGVDPLVGDAPADYAQFRALAERLPFRDGVFEHVVFATSFDHFVDPAIALREAKRVCHPDGEIDIWLGEKKAGAPRLAVSPEWYTRLVKPPLAEDQFHLKRPGVDDLKELARQVSLTVVAEEFHVVDDYRRNYFCRMRRSGAA